MKVQINYMLLLIMWVRKYIYFFNIPAITEIINRTTKMKNRTLAIDAAPAAIPVKPNTAATIAIIKKITA